MKALTQIFNKHQVELTRLKSALAEKRVRSVATSKHKITLLKSQALALSPTALDIRELVGNCNTVEDYMFITFLFFQTGHKGHLTIVFDTLFLKLERAQDLILIGKQMISFGMNGGYDFFSKANTCALTVYERIMVQETFDNASYGNVA